MEYKDLLEIAASWAAIVTATVAVYGYGRFRHEQRGRQKALEDYLRDEKLNTNDEGKRSVLHLMASLSMTEWEVLQAAFRSSKISPMPRQDKQGRADGILFEYRGDDLPAQTKF